MTLCAAIKLSVHFVERQLFEDVGFQVEPGDRIGLVGPNGSGKTTLLRLLNGEVQPDSGEIRVQKGIRIGYLPQDVHESVEGLLLDSVIAAIPGRSDRERDLAGAEKALKAAGGTAEQARLGERIAEIHHELDRLDWTFPRHEAEKILLGLGFDAADLQRSVSTLSGGWKMRAALATLLYRQPDLLLLDEPTNHLDIPSVRWVEQYLHRFKGALILVSHDRDFLNRQVRRIISFEPEGMKFYNGNYDAYLKARAEEEKALEARARNQEQKIKDAQKFIERFRAKATKARQAQSKIKLVRKMQVVQTLQKDKRIHFAFPEVSRSGREVLSLKSVSKGFGDHPLYRDLSRSILRQERVAVIGPNGCGKTTLLRLVAHEIETDRGDIALGHGVEMGYFAQHHSEMLNPALTVLEEVYQVVPDATLGYVRNVCGAFLFSGNDVDKRVDVLSGGERARVALAKLLVKPGNFMVMDEPTNHLDIKSSEVLIDALEGYGGTLLFVSHNQSFVNRLATRIWDIRNGEVIDYPGNLNDYFNYMEMEADAPGAPGGAKGRPDGSAPPDVDGGGKETDRGFREDRKAQKRRQAEQRRLIHSTLKPIRDELERLEASIAELESRQEGLEELLADPDIFKDNAKSVPMINEYHQVRKSVEDMLLKWEDCHDRLSATEERLGMKEATT
ncbi:MAG: ABC-F family ATP-binding cassette domain-containing protein [Deltaproteobacteria bacterium]|nr:ABC-F family ATP-binding cassette domain-containing protein [Deltaproteobacteria bacterium]MBW2283553.1 ABC-F family ATP-binding cassette domain-containing protein [Deltaproteobacteria bacterium]